MGGDGWAEEDAVARRRRVWTLEEAATTRPRNERRRRAAAGDESGSWPAVSIRRPNRLRHWAGLRIRPMAAEEIWKSPRVRRG